MSAYATIEDVQARMLKELSEDEQDVCSTLLEDAAVRIDAFNADASADAKKAVSCRMVIRVFGNSDDGCIPIGASQGTQSALGYSNSWTMSGASGELYLSKEDRKILGEKSRIGSYSPTQALVPEVEP